MRLAFSKPTADTEQQRALFDRVGAAGYDGLQLKASQFRSYLDDPGGFRERWSADPAYASALITAGALDPDGLANLRSLLSFAVAVESERIVFCHALGRSGLGEEDIAGFARVLSEVGREAADRGVALSLHHHDDQPVMHRRDLDVFFDAADHDAVGLTVDTAHLVKSGVIDIAGVVADFAPVIDNFHLKDFADGEFRLLGHGDIDFDKVFSTIRSVGYDGWLCVDEETDAGLVEAMEVSMDFLRRRL